MLIDVLMNTFVRNKHSFILIIIDRYIIDHFHFFEFCFWKYTFPEVSMFSKFSLFFYLSSMKFEIVLNNCGYSKGRERAVFVSVICKRRVLSSSVQFWRPAVARYAPPMLRLSLPTTRPKPPPGGCAAHAHAPPLIATLSRWVCINKQYNFQKKNTNRRSEKTKRCERRRQKQPGCSLKVQKLFCFVFCFRHAFFVSS